MESLDITSDGLRQQGYTLKKEGQTIALYYDNRGSSHRFGFYKNDWDKTVRQMERKLEEKGFEQRTISEIEVCMSSNHGKLTNGSVAASETSSSSYETEAPTEKLEGMSLEEWQQGLITRHNQLNSTISNSVKPLPLLKLPLEFALSIKTILNLDDCTLPFAGTLLGVPSSLKTVAVELFRRYWRSKYSDDFSPKAFVSHYGGLTKEQLKENDLLPKIRHRFFLTPELAPLFTGNEDDLKKAFGNLTRILDGKGFENDSGTQGGRGYHGNYMFTWLGATVDVSPRVHRLMGNLGPKLYFLRLPKAYKNEKDLIDQLRNPRFKEDLAKIETALFELLKWFEACPVMSERDGLAKMVWDSNKDDYNATRYIARLALLLGPLRGVVDVSETEDTQGSGYGFTIPIIEEPDRASQQLYNLARGHALSQGRNYITMEDVPLLVKVVLSTAPIARVAVFDLLIVHKGRLETADMKKWLGISHPTAHKAMLELELLQLVDGDKDGEYDNSTKVIML